LSYWWTLNIWTENNSRTGLLKKKIEKYGFIENIDFIAIAQKRATAQGNGTT